MDFFSSLLAFVLMLTILLILTPLSRGSKIYHLVPHPLHRSCYTISTTLGVLCSPTARTPRMASNWDNPTAGSAWAGMNQDGFLVFKFPRTGLHLPHSALSPKSIWVQGAIVTWGVSYVDPGAEWNMLSYCGCRF
ncbi:unnamed protein product [Fraxinus pennsylvanica]|uniref:Uncharacterized protein n=1 Tax=Fraxinus pennsylvanica TaxID=56036 RepID=A0AAD2E361_9LAMI|nr:unnamed protein product [Fraxinus pennsylvanica]